MKGCNHGGAAMGVRQTRIYDPRFLDGLEDVARTHIGEVVRVYSVDRAMDHEKSWIKIESRDGWRSELQAFRDGAIGVHLWCPENMSFGTVRGWVAGSDRPVILELWRALVSALRLSGGRGSMHVSLSVANEFPSARMRSTDLQRWAGVEDPAEPHVRDLADDLLRADGEWVVDKDATA
jgi:hypothetical protein